MKKIILLAIAVPALWMGCSKPMDMYNEEAVIERNATKIFGEIDPLQDWNMITSGSVTITANAPLDDIQRVLILTASPYGNGDARILNEVDVQKGETVTVVYDAPNYCTQLIAACISSKGSYYIRVFEIGTKAIDFDFSKTPARTRAAVSYPHAETITLGEGMKSMDAQRAEASVASEYGTVKVGDNVNGGTAKYYTLWKDGSWAGDRLWTVTSIDDATWKVDKGTVYKDADPLSEDEAATLQVILDTYLKKTGGKTTSGTNKKNNWEIILQNSSIFEVHNNYLTSDGSPLTVIPLQMNTTEGHYNSIYYYYYDPAKTAGMSSEEEVAFVKSLPKFKAVPGFKGDNKLRREKEYLLAYYGDAPTAGGKAVSNSIPKGYKIGFMNCKDYANKGSMNNCASGCTYGDGRLNFEVNHLVGHYFSAMSQSVSQDVYTDEAATKTQTQKGRTPDGMEFTSPRIAMFAANLKTYLCFEDGADCNFTDMILEIGHGVELVEDEPEVANAIYTMCFEDKPNTADYDMNDVVLRCYRTQTKLQLALVAAGGNDDVYIYGTGIPQFDGQEVHEIFDATLPDANGNRFVNTQKKGQRRAPVSYMVKVPADMTIPQYLKGIYIVNKNNYNQVIKVPEKVGEPPYAIIIPDEFQYPLEQVRIDNAYLDFAKWAQNINVGSDWYLYGVAEKYFVLDSSK